MLLRETSTVVLCSSTKLLSLSLVPGHDEDAQTIRHGSALSRQGKENSTPEQNKQAVLDERKRNPKLSENATCSVQQKTASCKSLLQAQR